jgi:hypothetical protein
MGFGAIIATGENNTPLDQDLAGCIAEVRIEQKLDEPTQFAVRFLDDIEDGRLHRANDDRLSIDTIVTVIVDTGEAMSAASGSPSKLTCLVRGPIVQDKSEMMIGGPGSSFEIHGLDRRDFLDRLCVPATRPGRASDVAREILDRAFDRLDIEDTTRVYDERRETLNQRTTDLDFLTRIAARNNVHFWVTYECVPSSIGSGYQVTETAHLASSPRRPEGGVSGAIASAIQLIPTSDLALRIHVPSGQCPNVTAFQVNVDGDRPSRYRAGSMPTEEIRPGTTEASDPQPPAGQGGQRLAQLGGVVRELCLPGSGDPQETQTRGEAALTAAGWFVQATASTTRHLLGGVLRPHDVIAAVGVGPRFGRNVAFRVKEVTHVITAAEHFMDLRLESNSLGEG